MLGLHCPPMRRQTDDLAGRLAVQCLGTAVTAWRSHLVTRQELAMASQGEMHPVARCRRSENR